MKVGIVISFMNGFGEKGRYHSQELGLAKQFVEEGHSVIVYKAVAGDEPSSESIGNSLVVRYLPVKRFGAQGIVDTSVFSRDLDALVYFSDTQFSLNAIDFWCHSNGVAPFYYVGAVESTSDSGAKRILMNLHYRLRTLPVYQRRGAVAKTPYIKGKLEAQGVPRVELAPVGIDFDLMDAPSDSSRLDFESLRDGAEALVLFVGKLERYKQPQKAIELLSMLPGGFKLVVIGKGSMETELRDLASRLGVSGRVCWIPSVSNSSMRYYYKAVDVFVNVNPDEIFGMAVIEAVYHHCATVALSAPGPDFILAGMSCHRTADSLEEMSRLVPSFVHLESSDLSRDKNLLVSRCSWHALVSLVEKTTPEGGLVK